MKTEKEKIKIKNFKERLIKSNERIKQLKIRINKLEKEMIKTHKELRLL